MAGLAAAGLLAGCSDILPNNTPKLFILTPKNTYDADLPKASWQLLVEQPDAPLSLDTTRIALQNSPTTIDYFAGSAWTDRAPLMVQRLLIESFENTGKIAAVGRDAVGLRADYVLKSDLRDFEADYTNPDAPPTVKVRLAVRLVKMPERQIVGEWSDIQRATASVNTTDAIIYAFDEALGAAMKRVVQWTLRTGVPS
ncbi:MAG TPA: ABC-type transport auxiliary lipoprotein family protein [Stellaceae bacterium]|nr:ABC-type transport auxiliary lipoprotein family protein [Stellaceae bacterium]